MDQYISEDYEHRVRERAYALWESAGRPAEQDQHFWFEAQREFENQHRTFATRAAGPHLPCRRRGMRWCRRQFLNREPRLPGGLPGRRGHTGA